MKNLVIASILVFISNYSLAQELKLRVDGTQATVTNQAGDVVISEDLEYKYKTDSGYQVKKMKPILVQDCLLLTSQEHMGDVKVISATGHRKTYPKLGKELYLAKPISPLNDSWSIILGDYEGSIEGYYHVASNCELKWEDMGLFMYEVKKQENALDIFELELDNNGKTTGAYSRKITVREDGSKDTN